MTSPNDQLVRVRVTYDWDAELTDKGYSHSRETTVWHGVGRAGASDAELDAACRRAAITYPHRASLATLGLVGVSRYYDRGWAPVFYLRPVGPAILRFGCLRNPAPGVVSYPVVGGWLAIVGPGCEYDGELVFRWWREDDREVFQTELCGFRPAIRGRRPRSPMRGLIYRWTQTYLHTFVMWTFHRWVRKHRDELLDAAAVQLE